MIAFRKGDVHHGVLLGDAAQGDAVALQHVPVYDVPLGAVPHLPVGRPASETFGDALRHVVQLRFEGSEVAAQGVVRRAEAFVHGFKAGVVEEVGGVHGYEFPSGEKAERAVAVPRPRHLGERERVAVQPDDGGGVETLVLPAHAGRYGRQGAAQSSVNGHVHAYLSAVDFVAFPAELSGEVVPDEAVEYAVAVYHAHAGLAHDALHHAYGVQVVGSVGIARHVGIAFQQLAVGIVYAAEHHGQVVQAGIAAGHERVERLVVQHRHEAGAPAGEVVDEVRAALFFFGGQQVVAVQEVFAEVAGDAAPGQRVTQHFPGASGIRIPGFVGVDKSYLIPPGMRLAPASRQAEQNYPAR